MEPEINQPKNYDLNSISSFKVLISIIKFRPDNSNYVDEILT
jgi:hypothetical protein